MHINKRILVSVLLVALLALSAVALSLAVLSRPAAAQLYLNVTDPGDNTVFPYTPGQLRWAIDQANNSPAGPDVIINFEVNLTLLNAQLPALTRNNNGDPNITIDGDRGGGTRATIYAGAAVGATGLTVNTSDCTVQNLVFQDFDVNGVLLSNASDNTVDNVMCYRIDGTGIMVTDGGGVTTGTSISGCQVHECARSAPGPEGTAADYYGIELEGAACISTDVSSTSIYDCGDFVSGFGGGLGIFGASINDVYGCNIGSSNGFTAEGNACDGVAIGDGADENHLGLLGRNVIIANGANGVRITGSTTGNNTLESNNIGVNALLMSMGNADWGVLVDGVDGVADGNEIGYETPAVSNYIGDNGSGGIGVFDSIDTMVLANAIGTDITLSLDFGNDGSGISIVDSSESTIGGDWEDILGLRTNYIGYNQGDGIQITGDSPSNRIMRNQFESNEVGGDPPTPMLGIDHNPLANEPNDPATYVYGTPATPNSFMPYPTITYAAETESTVVAAGTAVPDSQVYLFYTDINDAGYGEGQDFIARALADGTGNWALEDEALTAGDWITATATDTSLNTSEFCANYRVADEIPPDVSIVINNGDVATAYLDVTLTLTATDNLYPSTDLDYQVSNYADFHDATWQDVPSASWEIPWQLLAGADGNRTVYFRAMDPETNEGSDNASIYYKTEPPNGTVLINGGASVTGTPEVTLDLTVNDAFYDESMLEMAISNYSDLHDATWQPFSSTSAWSLLDGTGNRTVYVRFRDPLGNTSTNRTDSIYLDREAPTGSVAFQGGAQTSGTRDVKLDLSVSDNHFPPSQCLMQVSNHSDFAGVSWQSFKSDLDWTLLAGTGEKTVYAHFRDGVGNTSVTYSASIYLDTGAGATWYLSEGSNAWGFSTYVTIENPNAEQVTARVTYMTPASGAGAGSVVRDVTLPPTSQTTVDPAWDLTNADFSTVVECLEGKTIAVDRTMTWTGEGATCPGAHSSIGVAGPTRTWYLSEGSSNWGFETWVLVQNPNAAEATVNLTYMIEGEGPQNFTKKVAAFSRASFSMATDIGAKDASIQVRANLPVIAERSMYFDSRREGTESVGVIAPSNTFFLAEGTTAWGFTSYVLVQNPNAGDAVVTVTYMTPDGPVVQEPFTMPGLSRKTLLVNEVLAATDFSTRVDADVPVVAERAMYWESAYGRAAHNSVGLTAAHTTFFLPDGQRTLGWETWVLVQNPNPTDAEIELRWLGPDGEETVAADTVPANSRKTYDVGAYGTTSRCATVVTCTNGLKVMAERSMYCNDRGTGTDTVGGWTDSP
ncbi:MAG: hypothetical protein V1748_08030 [Actinomycetota bacterium]